MRWPGITFTIGFSMLGLFVPLSLSGEKPWDYNVAGYVTGRVLEASHSGVTRSPTHSVSYDFQVKGERYTGSYQCEGCMALEKSNNGQPIPIEYRHEDPTMNRPSGVVTEGRRRYFRFGILVGALLVAAGLAGFAFQAFRGGATSLP